MGSESQVASNLVKYQITSVLVLTYYNPQKELILEKSAIESGQGSALIQKERPVVNASHSLSKTEQPYA